MLIRLILQKLYQQGLCANFWLSKQVHNPLQIVNLQVYPLGRLRIQLVVGENFTLLDDECRIMTAELCFNVTLSLNFEFNQ